ncbi:MAG: hypothetical protein ACI38U_15610 [Corynebacterium sp.]|uniref:hypothetical protein n=1 Tax=Corynebacterium sp. TaxID=1720 RepID=UPI003F0E5ED9
MHKQKHRVSITGPLRIDGRAQSSARAVELLHLMAHEGPSLRKREVEEALYGGYCSRSSLWYPLKVCQDAGVDIRYDSEQHSVVLVDEVLFDTDVALGYLEQGDLSAALWMLDGWPNGKGAGAYSEKIAEELRRAIASTPGGLTCSELEDAYDCLDMQRAG